MNENGKADALSARENAHEQTQRLLKELHGAMADVMVFRRPSATQAQREKAEAAISLWRKVEAFLASSSDKLETDRRDLAALLKAAHELLDGVGQEADSGRVSYSDLAALQAATLPYQDRVDLFAGESCDCRDGEHEEDCPFLPENVERSMHPAERARELCIPASSSTVAEDLEDDIAEVICDSIDGPEWTSRHAAKAVVDYLTARNHPAATPGTVTPAAIIHRLSVMARVSERDGRLGDVQSCRDAMRIIGELQSHVTRLTAPDVMFVRDCSDPDAPPKPVKVEHGRIGGGRFSDGSMSDQGLPLDGQ